MAQQVSEIKASARPRSGTGGARAIRREGRVPAVIYGDGGGPQNVAVQSSELAKLIGRGRFLSTVFDLDIDGKKTRVIPREVQLDPVNGHARARRLPAGRRRRARSASTCRCEFINEAPVARPEARRRAQYRPPRGGGDLPGGRHSRRVRVQPRGPGDRPLDPHLGDQDARGRAADHHEPRLHGRDHRRPQRRGGGRAGPRQLVAEGAAPAGCRGCRRRCRRCQGRRRRQGARPARTPAGQAGGPAKARARRARSSRRGPEPRGRGTGSRAHEALRRPRQSGQRLCAPPPQRRLHGAGAHRRAPRARALEEALPRPRLRGADRRAHA